MSKINNGGPAFPDPGRAQSAKQREALTNTGMTLRDYFAAKAMASFIAWEETGGHALDMEVIAGYAYQMADAMLAAREVQS